MKRTKNSKGVTIPSQIRYVNYFEQWLKKRATGRVPPIPPRNCLLLRSVRMHPIPKVVGSTNDVWFTITTYVISSFF
jgi:hypothetical protein